MASPSPFLVALFALLVVGGVIHVAFLFYAFRGRKLSGRETVANGPGNDRPDLALVEGDEEKADSHVNPTSTPTVRCPNCHAVNHAAYSYCRECVSELHG